MYLHYILPPPTHPSRSFPNSLPTQFNDHLPLSIKPEVQFLFADDSWAWDLS